MLEIHSDTQADDRLDLADAPLGMLGVADDRTDFEEFPRHGRTPYRVPDAGASLVSGERQAAHEAAPGTGFGVAPESLPGALAGVVCARLCHDLGSPIGAMVNGVDLIAEIGAADAAEELALLGRSAGRAAALLGFLRLAFGAVREPAAAVSRKRIRDHAEAVLGGPRVVLRWLGDEGGGAASEAPEPLPQAAARALALMLLAGRAALGAGGTLTVLVAPAGGLPLAVVAEGDGVALGPARRSLLSGTDDALPEPRDVEFALLPMAVRELGARLEIDERPRLLGLRAVAA